jgi:hypothetical protein
LGAPLVAFFTKSIKCEEGRNIKEAFNRFCDHHPYLTLESAVEYFSILGGVADRVELDYFESVTAMVTSNFVENFSTFEQLVTPSYLLDSPYRELLMAVARGDGKYYSIVRKARLSDGGGSVSSGSWWSVVCCV